MAARVAVCCGSGGVGKTTVSAALALQAAAHGARVAVLTIDPARRLADSLGIGALTNTPRRVHLEAALPHASGTLDALMLDAKATFDELLRRLGSNPAQVERILLNRYYRQVSTELGGAHEYMAMMRLLDLVECGRYDLVVLDTPPTRHALEFLTAPDRLAAVLDEGVLRWLVMPTTRSGWRALELGSEAVAGVLKRLVGTGTVAEIAEFFELIRDVADDITARTATIKAHLASEHTRFYLVTSPAPVARDEALALLHILGDRHLPFGGFLVNRVVGAPTHPLDPAALPASGPLPPERWARVLDALQRAPALRRELSASHAAAVRALRAAGPPGAPCWTLPEQDQDLTTLPGLVALLPHLPSV